MATQETMERPEGLTDDHLEYLDELRESGVTNMFGARPYVTNPRPRGQGASGDG